MRRHAAIVLTLVLVFAGCGKLRENVAFVRSEIGDLQQISAAMQKKYPNESINIKTVSGGKHSMTITFVNSPIATRSESERAARAREAAMVAFGASHQPLDLINVDFMYRKKAWGVLLTRTDGSYSYPAAELKEGSAPAR